MAGSFYIDKCDSVLKSTCENSFSGIIFSDYLVEGKHFLPYWTCENSFSGIILQIIYWKANLFFPMYSNKFVVKRAANILKNGRQTYFEFAISVEASQEF